MTRGQFPHGNHMAIKIRMQARQFTHQVESESLLLKENLI